MGLLNWFSKLRENDLDRVVTRMNKITTVALEKLELLKQKYDRKFPVDKFQALVANSTVLVHSFMDEKKDMYLPRLLDDSKIEPILKTHLNEKVFELSKVIAAQQEWIEENYQSSNAAYRVEQIRDLVSAEISLLTGAVAHDLKVLLESARHAQLHSTHDEKSLEDYSQYLDELDLEVLRIASETSDFRWVHGGERERLERIADDFRGIENSLNELVLSKKIDPANEPFVRTLVMRARKHGRLLRPIFKDPTINPLSTALPESKVVSILRKLRPCHIVPDAKGLIAILKSGTLSGPGIRGITKERWMLKAKAQEDSLFISAAGPYTHLPLKDPFAFSLIIFKLDLYELPMVMYPRDSGGYPDISKEFIVSEAVVEDALEHARFTNKVQMYKHMAAYIRHRGLREVEPKAQVGRALPKEGIALWPEIVVNEAIDLLKYVEAIIIPSEIYYSDKYSAELEPLKKKYKYGGGKHIRLIHSDDVLKEYWKFLGLTNELVQE